MLEILCADEPVARWRNDAVVRRLVTHEKRNKWGSRVVNEFKKKMVAVPPIHAPRLGVLFRPGRLFPCATRL